MGLPLREQIAIVTGASRGAGRGIAEELGAAGATVYVTGRTTRASAPAGYEVYKAHAGLREMPGNIDDTAAAVTAAGGRGIAVACDHTDPPQVAAMIALVEREHGRIDLLVNNAWGGHESFTLATLDMPFWEQPIDHWVSMFDHGVRNHLLAARAIAPVLVKQKRGLVVATTFWDRGRYIKGNLYYDLAKSAINRLAFGISEELGPHGVTSLALSPGWMRTELILNGFSTDEEHWQDVPPLARTESPRYIGRAIAALAADPNIHAKTGAVHYVGDLAVEYGFTDIDGRVVPPYEMP